MIDISVHQPLCFFKLIHIFVDCYKIKMPIPGCNCPTSLQSDLTYWTNPPVLSVGFPSGERHSYQGTQTHLSSDGGNVLNVYWLSVGGCEGCTLVGGPNS